MTDAVVALAGTVLGVVKHHLDEAIEGAVRQALGLRRQRAHAALAPEPGQRRLRLEIVRLRVHEVGQSPVTDRDGGGLASKHGVRERRI